MSNPATPGAAGPPAGTGPAIVAAASRPTARKRSHSSRAAVHDPAVENASTIPRRADIREEQIRAREDEATVAESGDFAHGKDEKHSFRDEAILETITSLGRSPKKGENTPRRDPIRANMSLKLRRKPFIGAGNIAGTMSIWQLPKRVLARFFVIFILLAVLATSCWHWIAHLRSLQTPTTETQVTELEALLRKTTKMMQVQLEIVDMKISKEVDRLKKELEEKMEDQAIFLGTELRNLKVKTGDIEASLVRLSERGFPTRQEVEELVTSIIDTKVQDFHAQALTLDDVRAAARKIIEAEIEKHSQDGIAKIDYALGTGGGKVVDHSKGYFVGMGMDWGYLVSSFFSGTPRKHPLASKVLEPSFGEPGQCLPLEGSKVYIDIALRTAIFPDAFTLEHVSENVAYDISSAPKNFRVFGWLDTYKKEDTVSKPTIQILLGEFAYDIQKANAQTFPVSQDSVGKLINMVKLDVLSNYGSSSHTCIYRFRVHGSDPRMARPYIV
eukprot:c24362_g1_i1 orf=380-1879(+)